MSIPSNDLAVRWDAMQFDVRRSVRYHTKRRGFFDRADKWTNVIAVFFGSATIYSMTATKPIFGIAAAILVSLTSTVNLVVASSQRARDHADLARRFIELEKELYASPNEDLLRKIAHSRMSIEAEEPPVLRVLDCICHNELCKALGREGRVKIGLLQKFCANFFDYDVDSIKP